MRVRATVVAITLVLGACSSGDRPPSGVTSTTTELVVAASPPGSSSTTTEAEAAPPETFLLPPSRNVSTEEAQRNALRRVKDDLVRLHPAPFWRFSEDEFDAEVAALEAAAGEFSDDEFVVEVQRLMAHIGGHTGAFSTDRWDVALIQFYMFSDGIFVVQADDPSLIGAELLLVGSATAGDALQAVSPLVSFDNSATVALVAPVLLASPRTLAALGLVQPGPITYRLLLPDGLEVDHVAPIVSFEEKVELFGGFPVGLPAVSGVDWLQWKGFSFWSEYRPDDDLVFFQYNSVVAASQDPIGGPTRSVGDMADVIDGLLAEHQDARLVIDLRHNPGGDLNTYAAFFALIEEYGSASSCRVSLLIGRQTFSAASVFATQAEAIEGVKLYGEPTGGSPNVYANPTTRDIRDVGITLRISTAFFDSGSPGDERPWITPPTPVALTSSSFLRGDDPVMDQLLADDECS
jgi:hypothetical protein